jgi:hypothetical protein
MNWSPGGRIVAWLVPISLDPDCSQPSDWVPEGAIAHAVSDETNDADNDLLRDAWEIDYFGDLGYGRYDDPDSDLADNLEEFLAGTNPIVRDNDGDDDGLLDTWEYRFFGTLDYDGDADPDADGLSNATELTLGIHPGRTAVDQDRDKLPDAWEIRWFGDLLEHADGDLDGDGLTNLDAYEFGISPLVGADFNGDGSVDRDDFEIFSRCLTGPNVAYDPHNLTHGCPGCALPHNTEGIIPADLDADGDVDLHDFAAFQRDFGRGDGTLRRLTTSTPACGQTLPRTARNFILLDFDGDIAAPPPDAIQIRKLLPGGLLGDLDLSSSFVHAVEPSDPRGLKIQEAGSVLRDREWYAILHTGRWPGVEPFKLDLCVLIGDVNNDGVVSETDLPPQICLPDLCPYDWLRADVDGSGQFTPVDVLIIIEHNASTVPARPPGHSCNP